MGETVRNCQTFPHSVLFDAPPQPDVELPHLLINPGLSALLILVILVVDSDALWVLVEFPD